MPGCGWCGRALRPRFGEWPTALTLLAIVLGTNYINYTAIAGAMSHNWLFGWYAALLLLTPTFYERPGRGRSLAIGAIIGLMALTRPTDILVVILVLGWGLRPDGATLRGRLAFWQRHWSLLLLALVAGAAVLSIQPIYWHYVSGHWIINSYQEQGFDWLKPHLWDGIFSFKGGWLLYSPLLVVALAGFAALRRQQPTAFWPMLVFMFVFTYVAFAWKEWLYGGSLGQRAMIQTYAVLAWPLAAAHRWLLTRRVWLLAYAVFAALTCYYSLWLTYQAHRGGLLVVGQMTRAYWWRILGRYEVPAEARLALDTNYDFTGAPRKPHIIWEGRLRDAPRQHRLRPPTAGGPLLTAARRRPPQQPRVCHSRPARAVQMGARQCPGQHQRLRVSGRPLHAVRSKVLPGR